MSRIFSVERYIASRISRRLFATSRVTRCDDLKIPKKEASVIDKPAEDTDLLKTDTKLLNTSRLSDKQMFDFLFKKYVEEHESRINAENLLVQVKKPKFTFPSIQQNNFAAILGANFFVDKTAVIGKIMNLLLDSDSPDQDTYKRPIFITAPRRFGKTTVFDMLECFFGGTLSEDTFRSLKIGENEKAFEWYNRFTVVFVTFGFAMSKIKTRGDCVESCRIILHYTFERYENMVSYLPPTKVTAFNNWLDEEKYQDKNEEEVLYGLRFLIECIAYVSEKPILLLIDEFDKICVYGILNEAGSNLSEIIGFCCGMVANVVKHDPVCTVSIFTGITDIPSKGFSDLNNLIEIQFLNNGDFYEFYGVLESEFNELMTRKTISEKVKNQADAAREWYDGYNYRGTKVFNTFSVSNFIEGGEVRSYWQESGKAEGLLQSLHDDLLRYKILSLLNGESVSIKLLELRPENFSHVKDGRYVMVNPDFILTFLKQQGYLTAVANTNVESTNNDVEGSHSVQVRIPNREIQREFSETMRRFYYRYNFNPNKKDNSN